MNLIHITSLGCPKNFVDSEVMIGLLQENGWKLVSNPEEADVLLVNTCGFIQPAVEEGIDEILELAEVKKQFPHKKLVVTGCMVQRYQDSLVNELPEIDLLVGTEGVKDIYQLIKGLMKGDEKQLHLPDLFLMDAKLPRQLATPSFRAWMKITEGCDNRCSYCMIPSIRGPLRSRPIDDLIVEAKWLEEKGVKEVSLIAQDLTAYGIDKAGSSQLYQLLEKLLEKTTIPWIRLLYLYPTGIEERLFSLMAKEKRIVPYLDIPFQHVSSSVLKRMNRHYTKDDLENIITTARSYLPDIALRTTFLLGFPGETEQDVMELETFMQRMELDHVGVFGYTNEDGAPSEFFENQVEEGEKERRVNYILSLQAEISEKKQKKYVGRIEQVLVEGLSRESDLLLEGRTRFQAPDIDGCVLINDGQANPGDLVSVEITESQTYDLVGAII